MAFVYREDLGCSVYDPPLTGFVLKNSYFTVRDECAESLLHLQKMEMEKRPGFFCWAELVAVADAIGLPIVTTCEFLEKWGAVEDGTFANKGLTSTQKKAQVNRREQQ